MAVDTDFIARPVQLAQRSRQGIALGMDLWQTITLALAIAIAVLSAVALGPIGVVVAAPVYLPLALIAVLQVHGMAAPRMIGLWMMKKIRTAVGANQQVYRPESRHLEGTLNLPGGRAGVQIWDVDGLAAAYDPAEKTVSITAELEVAGFLMRDIPDRHMLAERLGQVLASFTQREGIKRVAMQERTTPTTIRAARDHFDENKVITNEHDPLVQNYMLVMDTSEGYAVAHRNYLTLTFDLPALGTQLKALGGGKEAIQALAAVEARNVSDALQASDIKVRRWLSPRQIAALGRSAFDLEFIPSLHSRNSTNDGVDLRAMGTMYLEEPSRKNGVVLTDSAIHTTMWVHEWPRMAAPVGFVADIVFARNPVTDGAIPHIFTTVLNPVPVSKALKRIRQEKKIWRSNEVMRAKRNAGGAAFDRADYEALERQEEELLAGHGEFEYGAYLTVSAPDEETLEQNIAGMRNAMLRVGMEGQILYTQQAEALMVNALPIGRGMK